MNTGYLKFTGDYAQLKHMGYTFQKLFAGNVMTWNKGDIWIHKREGYMYHSTLSLYRLVTFLDTNPVGRRHVGATTYYKFYAVGKVRTIDDHRNFEYKETSEENQIYYHKCMKLWGDVTDDTPDDQLPPYVTHEAILDDLIEQFDAVLTQGVESTTQKDQYYFELVNLKREGIVDVPQSSIIKALPLVGKSNLIEDIEQQEQAAKEDQARVRELELMQKELINSQTEQSLALAQERRGRVVTDIARSKELTAEAEGNKATASLNRAKAMVEVQKLRTDQILQVMEFVNLLHSQEKAELEEKDAVVMQQAAELIKASELQHEQRNIKQKQAAQGQESPQEQGDVQP